MLHGGQASPVPSTVLLEYPRLLSTRVTEYVWRRFQWASVSDWMGPVLYRNVPGSVTSVWKVNSNTISGWPSLLLSMLMA